MSVQSDLVAKRNELDAVNARVKKIREQSNVGNNEFDLTKSSELSGTKEERVNEMRKLKTKMDALGAEVDALVAVVEAFKEDTGSETQHEQTHGQFDAKGERRGEQKSIGQRFIESPSFKSFREGKIAMNQVKLDLPDIEVKTLMTESAGFAPQAIRTGYVEGYPVEPIGLFNLIPKGTTGQIAVVYMEETTRNMAAAEATEGSGAYAESAIAYTERSESVQNIGHFIPVTGQQLEDVPMIQSLIDNDMRMGLMERLDSQLINGDAAAPNVRGFLNVTGRLTQSAAGVSALDALYKAITQIGKNAFVPATNIVLNGEDWEPIQLMKDDDGGYIWGHPANIGPTRIWGRPVTVTYRLAKGTGLVGAFNKMSYYERRGIVIEISDSHDTYFIYNKLAIRASVRACYVWTRPQAFCEVDSLS